MFIKRDPEAMLAQEQTSLRNIFYLLLNPIAVRKIAIAVCRGRFLAFYGTATLCF